jgi:hypothetical protein
MSSSPFLSVDQLNLLPPLIFGVIRWKGAIGDPIGDRCGGFDILVEEHPATRFRDAGGHAEPSTDPDIWKVVSDSVSCQALPDQGPEHAIRFRVTGLHLNGFPDGGYRITPSLSGNWSSSGVLALLGYRVIEPARVYVALTKDNHFRGVEFEVVRRGRFSGRRLG